MFPFELKPEPDHFDKLVRQPGTSWLRKNEQGKLPDYWRQASADLEEAFQGLCAYTAMYESDGVVDHFIPVSKDRNLAYEWSNLRNTGVRINAWKGDAEVLDPFEVKADWFEIILPSLQLVITDAMPEQLRSKARFTMARLHLVNDRRIIRRRKLWLDQYRQGDLSLKGLYSVAPLVAAAVEKSSRT